MNKFKRAVAATALALSASSAFAESTEETSTHIRFSHLEMDDIGLWRPNEFTRGTMKPFAVFVYCPNDPNEPITGGRTEPMYSIRSNPLNPEVIPEAEIVRAESQLRSGNVESQRIRAREDVCGHPQEPLIS